MQLPKTCWLPYGWRLPKIIHGKATVTTEDNRPAQTYVRLTENSFKTRFANHKSSFSDPKKRLSTELSNPVWYLKEAKLKLKITWKILKQTSLF